MDSSTPASKGAAPFSKCRYGTMVFNANDRLTGASLAHYGEWAEQELDVMGQVVQPGQNVLEVGGNLGAHTLWFSRTVGPDGAVYVAEPQRLDFQTLCANTAINGLTNVHALPVSLSREAGSAQISNYDPARPYRRGRNLSGNAGKAETVAVTTVDALKLPNLSVIKINAPVDPIAVLAGAIDTIKASRPALYFPVGGLDEAPDQVQFIRDLSYTLWSHVAYLHSPVNYNDADTNLFPGQVVQNVLAMPQERNVDFDELIRI